MTKAEPPTAAEAHEQDLPAARPSGSGFWLRTYLGGGSTSFETSGVSASGASGQVVLEVGSLLASNLVLFGVLAGDVISAPTMTVGSVSVSTTEDVIASSFGLGGGAGWLSPSRDIFISAALLIPQITLEHRGMNLAGNTEKGFGFELTAGKQWIVKPTLALGAAARAMYGTMKDTGSPDRWTARSFGAAFTLTWVPKGLRTPSAAFSPPA